jgi:hypothetical protein
MLTRLNIFPLLLPLSLIGCAPDPDLEEAEASSALFQAAVVSQRVDSVLVSIPDAPRLAVEFADIRLRIGAATQDSSHAFGRVTDLVEGDDGRFYVLDGGLREVVALGANGEILWRSGERGRGPGAFEAPQQLLWLPWARELAVWDPALQRVTVLASDGSIKSTHALATSTDLFGFESELSRPAARIAVLNDGYLLEMRSNALKVPVGQQRAHLVRLGSDFKVRDTLRSVLTGQTAVVVRKDATSEQRQSTPPQIFSPRPHWQVLSNGEVVVAGSGRYEMTIIDTASTTDQRVVVSAPVEAVTRDDRLTYIRARPERERGGAPVVVLERIGRKRFALLRPAVTDLRAGPSATFWVRRFESQNDPDRWRSREVDIFDHQGSWVGGLMLPAGVHPICVSASRVYALLIDSVGAESVGVFPNPFASTSVRATNLNQ